MNLDRVINMVIRQVTNILVKRGVNGAIDLASKRRGTAAKPIDPNLSPEERAAAERAREEQANAMGKRMQDLQKITRRMK